MKRHKYYYCNIGLLFLLFCLAGGNNEREAYFPQMENKVIVRVSDKERLISFCEKHSEIPKTCKYYEHKLQVSYQLKTSGFYIDKYPVSIQDYLYYCKNQPCDPLFKEKLAVNLAGSNFNYPVTGVTWEEARAYCRFFGKRLPSRDEYEIVMYKSEIYPWNDYSSLIDPANKRGSPKRTLRPIASNPMDVGNNNVYDVYSNCPEWTSTDYCNRRNTVNPKITLPACTNNVYAIIKGQYYYMGLMELFIFAEPYLPLDDRNLDIGPAGFRCARDAK